MMKSTFNALLAAAVSLYAGTASAATDAYTPSGSDLSLRWAVPEAAASSGSGDVYLQIEAPTTYQWVAAGIGSGMRGAQIFMIYADGNGNVTLSTRTGQGHFMPEYSERSAELIEGSGISGNNMIANIRCSDCSSLDLTGTNDWIAAWKQGSALDSTDTSERIDIHDSEAVYTVDFAQATFSSQSSNPFAGGSNSNKGSGGKDDDSGSESGDDSKSGSGGAVSNSDDDDRNRIMYAHGIVMSIVFVIAYPIGSLLMPVIGRWLVHASWQFLSFLGMWTGFGLGYVYATDNGYWWNNTHVRLGTIVVALISVQPFLGVLHHLHFKKNQARGFVSHCHIWYGRIMIILGIVNGGLGLDMAGAPLGFVIAYGVVAGVMTLLYLFGIFVGMRNKTRRQKIMSPQMTQEEQYRR